MNDTTYPYSEVALAKNYLTLLEANYVVVVVCCLLLKATIEIVWAGLHSHFHFKTPTAVDFLSLPFTPQELLSHPSLFRDTLYPSTHPATLISST